MTIRKRHVVFIVLLLIYAAVAASAYELKSLQKGTIGTLVSQVKNDDPLSCKLDDQKDEITKGTLSLLAIPGEMTESPCLFVGCSGFF